MKKVCVVTATRAEYGVLKNLLYRIEQDDELELQLVVTGTHLINEFGRTVEEIEQDGIYIYKKIPIMKKDDSVTHIMANAIERFGTFWREERPDLLIVVGDRYEIMAISEVAVMLKIPIAHISGGEVTEGVVDDTIRHCITKMSNLHFPGCELYRKRIIQMGERPETVFNYGDIGVENVYKMQFYSRVQLKKLIEFLPDEAYVCVTYHPETLSKSTPEDQIRELLLAIDNFPKLNFIFTGANADEGGHVINSTVQKYVERHSNCRFYMSLGVKKYLSLMKYSVMVMGNSSSGIIEAPCFGIPTVNIGDRQKGRLQSESVIDCKCRHMDIINAIQMARTLDFTAKAKNAINPYGNGNTSDGIVKEIKKYLSENHSSKKKFYDLNLLDKEL